MTVPGRVFFGCARPPNAPSPLIRIRVPEAGPDPGTSKFAPMQEMPRRPKLPTSAKHGHVTYQNEAFRMLVAVMPTTGPNSEPGVTILLQGVVEGR